MTARTGPISRKMLAAELEAAFSEQRPPRLEIGDGSDWINAVSDLLHRSRLDAGEYGLRHLRAEYSELRCVGRMGAVFDNLPLNGTPLPFDDDPTKDVQIVAREGADTVLLLFCGRAQKIGLPIALMHRWAGRLNASLIYLRDFQRFHYLMGIASLGTTRDAAVAELRRIVTSLGARRVVCYGNSAGGFAAMHYALDLGAEAAVSMGGTTNLTPEFNAFLSSEQRALELRKLRTEFPGVSLDLRRLYAGASNPPRVRIVYGADYWHDRFHAEHMGVLPCVTLHPLEGFDGHNAVTELIIRRQFEMVLRWLVAPPAASRPALKGMTPVRWLTRFRDFFESRVEGVRHDEPNRPPRE